MRICGVSDYLGRLPERLSGEGVKIDFPTGLTELDGFGPLLVRGQLFTVGARTNVGKTAMALTLAANAAKQKKRVLVFSTETSSDEILDRLVLILGGKAGDAAGAESLLTGLDIFVCDGFTPEVPEIEAVIKRVNPDVFIFDHLQHAGSSTEHRYNELSRFTRGLHDLARRYSAAGLVTSQLNRSAEREEPALHHLKECGTIEEESRAVLIMKRLNPNLQAETFPVACALLKNKGPMGTRQLLLNAKASRFESMMNGGAHA